MEYYIINTETQSVISLLPYIGEKSALRAVSWMRRGGFGSTIDTFQHRTAEQLRGVELDASGWVPSRWAEFIERTGAVTK